MAKQGQTEAEKLANVYDAVCDVADSYDAACPYLEFTGFGYYFPGRNDARQIRHSNDAFRNLSLPQVKGNVKQSNKSVFTSRFVWGEYSVSEAIAHVFESGQFDDMVAELSENRPSWTDEECQMVMVFNLFTVAKGWVAEKAMSKLDEFAKLWETNDLAGQDFQVGDSYVQLKNTSFGYTRGNPSEDSRGNEIVYYKFDANGQIHYSFADYTVAHNAAADASLVGSEDLKDVDFLVSL